MLEAKRVLVPVSGDKADDEAVRLGCLLARRARGRVHVLHVITIRRDLPLDAEIVSETQRGEEILRRAEKVAHGENCPVETELLQAREVGPSLVEEAVERGVEAIVMGISYKRKFGRFDLGTTVPYVLQNAPCHVLLFQESSYEEIQ